MEFDISAAEFTVLPSFLLSPTVNGLFFSRERVEPSGRTYFNDVTPVLESIPSSSPPSMFREDTFIKNVAPSMSLLSGIARRTEGGTTGSKTYPSLLTSLVVGSFIEPSFDTRASTSSFSFFGFANETFGISGLLETTGFPCCAPPSAVTFVSGVTALATLLSFLIAPIAKPSGPAVTNNC